MTPRCHRPFELKRLFAFFFGLLTAGQLLAQPAVWVEDMTWVEVRQALAQGHKTVILYAGSTEQNGPHMVTGKHNVIARYVAEQIARRLGHALVYPVLPFAPTGSFVPAGGHMRFPGSISLSPATYGAVLQDAALSAAVTGFSTILLMGDHGDGQDVLKKLAQTLGRQFKSQGIQVLYIGDLYYKSFERAKALLAQKGLALTHHAGVVDTSELMFVAAQRNESSRLLRPDQFAAARKELGSDGGVQHASAELGERFIAFKVESALAQIQSLSRSTTAPKQP